ncbi:hypothetical protein CLG85_006665 [Yangia mangrovi]|uniref:Uncharacterized protein n=1 Tax=Alloyangia mangrovi TaxID=1779329 RepID=A0A2A3JSW8_9RHOB|nr:hypothetical protein [Alloyangia mangrovi]MCA0939834.1 hypothetical protein [Alloyangia pacifica]MCA0944974.1 hypothetical protein [Alloyangia pacifica]MCT4370030.1 hypothetical protein [Alloyangia mangrovi]
MFRAFCLTAAIVASPALPSLADTVKTMSPEIEARLDELSGHRIPKPTVVLIDDTVAAECGTAAMGDCADLQPARLGPPRRGNRHPKTGKPALVAGDGS